MFKEIKKGILSSVQDAAHSNTRKKLLVRLHIWCKTATGRPSFGLRATRGERKSKVMFLAASRLATHTCSRSTVTQKKNKRLLAVYIWYLNTVPENSTDKLVLDHQRCWCSSKRCPHVFC